MFTLIDGRLSYLSDNRFLGRCTPNTSASFDIEQSYLSENRFLWTFIPNISVLFDREQSYFLSLHRFTGIFTRILVS